MKTPGWPVSWRSTRRRPGERSRLTRAPGQTARAEVLKFEQAAKSLFFKTFQNKLGF